MSRAIPAMAAAAALGAACSGEPRVQPIPFNHKVHVARAKLECESCHESASEKPFAGLPRVDKCMECHRTMTPKNPAAVPYIEAVRRHAREGTEVAWQRVYKLSPTVYFSHRRHTELGGLECKECHGDMAALERPPEEPIAQTLDMEHCSRCHRSRGLEDHCSNCHR